ncbi:unnamed protein product [Durusdinium trenchii]|uniref:Uncharacterized protein n=1 Tax=Durusdinium trenchii TaxID=1381693 RepID=A0ABP0S654_9DINO
MADVKDRLNEVPSRDGSSKTWRRYCKELPEITTSETDKGERYYNPWHRDQRWRDWEETPFEEQVEQAVDAPEGYTAVPQTSDAGEEAAPHSPAGSPNRTRQTQRSPSRKTEQQRMIDGLGPMDSFILDVLRGWRLLVAASLTNDEWRDILASTGNKLDYPAIAEALQTLWDEQLNHHHGASKGTVLQQHWVETADPWYNAAWHESSWDTEDWHESDWHSMDQFGAWPQAVNDPVDNTATTDDDPELQEALEAEKAAEALAVEARRTWSQAQQATTALRRDRGFGQFAGTSSSKGGKGPIRCHICSGPHFARYCPDRQHPQYRKGGGKQLSPAELDAYLFKGKGKGMRKGKDQMMSSWDDSYMAPWDVMYTQKGKNKNAGKGGKLRSTVNVYGMDYGGMDFSMMELHTLEFHETMEAEIAACRTSLGALQWLAVQSQPLITARCNLLITELSTDPKIQIAQELQEMIRELRKEGSTLKFFKLPGVRRWTDLCVVGLGDQVSLTFFLRHRTWQLKFDPNFIVSAKKQPFPSILHLSFVTLVMADALQVFLGELQRTSERAHERSTRRRGAEDAAGRKLSDEVSEAQHWQQQRHEWCQSTLSLLAQEGQRGEGVVEELRQSLAKWDDGRSSFVQLRQVGDGEEGGREVEQRATELQELQERLRLRGAPGEESEVRGVVRRMAGVWRGSGRYVFEFREAH